MKRKKPKFSEACEEMKRQGYSRISLALGLAEMIASKPIEQAVKQILNSGEHAEMGLGVDFLQLAGEMTGLVTGDYEDAEECKRDAILVVSIFAFTIWSLEEDDDSGEEWQTD